MDASGVKDEDNSKLTVNIRSDETVGKRNTYVLTIYYVPILAVFLVVPILFWRGTIRGKMHSESYYCYSKGCLLEIFLCHFIIRDKRYSIARLLVFMIDMDATKGNWGRIDGWTRRNKY